MAKSLTKTILAVDDEKEVLSYVDLTLQSIGCKVIAASNGNEAITLMDKNKGEIDLLLTDVMMPEMSGIELAEKIQAIHPDTRVIFMSAYMCPSMARQDISENEHTFVQKPFTPATLISKVKKIFKKDFS